MIYKSYLGDSIVFKGCPESSNAEIYADEDRLRLVIDNLISNAIKQTPKDRKEIVVQIEVISDSVQISVKDNGAGIAQENLEKIFEQFYSILTEYSITGSGIGLYISRQTILAHGGTIKAYSKGKNQGSTFTITLPKIKTQPEVQQLYTR